MSLAEQHHPYYIAPTSWTEERVERMKALQTKGLSCAQIARKLGGITRNAVIGKLSRMHLNVGREAGIETRNKIRSEPREYHQSPKIPADFRPLNIPFLQTKSIHCKEVVGRGDDHLAVCCGHVRIHGRPYCEVHTKINYNPLKQFQPRRPWRDKLHG